MTKFESKTGEGVIGTVRSVKDGKIYQICVGNEKLMNEYANHNQRASEIITNLESRGRTVLQLAIDKEISMIFSMEEEHAVKPEAATVI